MQANLRGLNPHGECRGVEVPAEMAALIPERWKNRLLTREECAEFDKEMLKMHPTLPPNGGWGPNREQP